MNVFLRLAGAGALLTCGFFISREYSSFVRARLASLENLSPEELEAEGERAEKNIKVAQALLIGGALAAGVMIL